MDRAHTLTFGPFRLDTISGHLRRQDDVVPLRPRSLAMLKYLAERPGRVITKAELLQQVWNGAHVSDDVLRASVRDIRRALGDAADAPQYLETVGGQGYRFLQGGDDLLHQASGPMVNLIDHLVYRGALVQQDEQWTVREETKDAVTMVPEGLRLLLMLRLEALLSEERHVLEVASVAGITYDTATVAAGLQQRVEDIDVLCESLATRGHFIAADGLVTWPDGTFSGRYRFQHALYRQVLYDQVGVARRAHVHRRVGACLEAGYGKQGYEMAAELAMHFEQGHDVGRASLWLNAIRSLVPS